MSGELKDVFNDAEFPERITTPEMPFMIAGRRHDYTPSNASIGELAVRFLKGETIFVRLEPGDATRYDLFVIPLESMPTFRPGSYGVKQGRWAFVANVNIGQKRGTFVQLESFMLANFYNDELLQENDFTRLAVCWFIGWFSHVLHER